MCLIKPLSSFSPGHSKSVRLSHTAFCSTWARHAACYLINHPQTPSRGFSPTHPCWFNCRDSSHLLGIALHASRELRSPPRSRALPCFAPSQKVFSFLPSSLLRLCSDLKKISGITQPMHSTLWTPTRAWLEPGVGLESGYEVVSRIPHLHSWMHIDARAAPGKKEAGDGLSWARWWVCCLAQLSPSPAPLLPFPGLDEAPHRVHSCFKLHQPPFS